MLNLLSRHIVKEKNRKEKKKCNKYLREKKKKKHLVYQIHPPNNFSFVRWGTVATATVSINAFVTLIWHIIFGFSSFLKSSQHQNISSTKKKTDAYALQNFLKVTSYVDLRPWTRLTPQPVKCKMSISKC